MAWASFGVFFPAKETAGKLCLIICQGIV